MELPPFLLDHWLSAYEFLDPPIAANLASSTGPRWTIAELLAAAGTSSRETLDGLTVSYAPPNGSALLRARIAQFHDVDPETVVVTTGASEALVALFCLVAEPGGNVVLPNLAFPTMPTMSRAWGLDVRTYALEPARRFAQTAEGILAAVDGRTRLVLVNTPHNPTGAVLPRAELVTLAESLADRGVPLLIDEVYHPLYHGTPVPSAATLPGTIVTGDMSKALSLSGLRIGWVIDRDAARRDRLVDARSYLTISSSPITEALATLALTHVGVLLARLEETTKTNLAALHRFMDAHRHLLDWVPPAGGTVAFPWLVDGGDTRPLCETLARAGVLVAPGDCFGMPSHMRVGLGIDSVSFADALDRMTRVLAER